MLSGHVCAYNFWKLAVAKHVSLLCSLLIAFLLIVVEICDYMNLLPVNSLQSLVWSSIASCLNSLCIDMKCFNTKNSFDLYSVYINHCIVVYPRKRIVDGYVGP